MNKVEEYINKINTILILKKSEPFILKYNSNQYMNFLYKKNCKKIIYYINNKLYKFIYYKTIYNTYNLYLYQLFGFCDYKIINSFNHKYDNINNNFDKYIIYNINYKDLLNIIFTICFNYIE